MPARHCGMLLPRWQKIHMGKTKLSILEDYRMSKIFGLFHGNVNLIYVFYVVKLSRLYLTNRWSLLGGICRGIFILCLISSKYLLIWHHTLDSHLRCLGDANFLWYKTNLIKASKNFERDFHKYILPNIVISISSKVSHIQKRNVTFIGRGKGTTNPAIWRTSQCQNIISDRYSVYWVCSRNLNVFFRCWKNSSPQF